ncbi:MAG: PP2C family protein-serine/threonine phosphatase, partial [Planctomycetota bacterium]
RTVICAALGEPAGAVDLLYLDIPIDKTTPDMLEFVRALCRRIISTRNGLILTESKAQRSVLDYQLSLAREIQSRLAPTIPQGLPGIELTLYYKPVVWVGADYYDVWLPADGRLAFAIGRVSDKGLPAAMAMSELRTILRIALSFCSELSEVMKLVNQHLIRNLPGRMSVTLLLGVFDQPTGNLQYVNAGSVQAFIVGPQSAGLALDQPDNPTLGTADASFKTNVEIIQQNAQLLIFTDGLTEATSPDGTEFGLKRVINLLKITDDRSPSHIINSLTRAVADFRHPCPQQADITVFGLFYSGSTSS